jgi:hypothetical protein
MRIATVLFAFGDAPDLTRLMVTEQNHCAWTLVTLTGRVANGEGGHWEVVGGNMHRSANGRILEQSQLPRKERDHLHASPGISRDGRVRSGEVVSLIAETGCQASV